MKVVILAGGHGTRLAEETAVRPKPMVEVGGRPMLWHVMKIYGDQGYTDFVICLGYKGYMIKEYFANYFLHMSDVTIDIASGSMEVHETASEPWRVTLVETGRDTMTGGRIKRIGPYVDGPFHLTYGDGVGDVDLTRLVDHHQRSGATVTVTAVRPPARFGRLAIGDDGRVEGFAEKPSTDGGWINGGFFVVEPAALSQIDGDDSIWEREPMERIAAAGGLHAVRHDGFWMAMDTLRDKTRLDELCAGGDPPWL